MIDATKGPAPAWRRKGMLPLLSVLIVLTGYAIWAKEINKPSSSASSPPAVSATVATVPAAKAPPPTSATTIPGGIPLSSRNPFSG